MTRRALPPLLLVLGLAAAAGCGKKGPVQAPLVRVPQPVEGFKAFQRGAAFRLEWTLPGAYADGTPFPKPVEVEVWVVEEEVAQPPSAAPSAPSDKSRPAEGGKAPEAKPGVDPAAGGKAAETQPAEQKAAETKPAEPKTAATVATEIPAAGKEPQAEAKPEALPPEASIFSSSEMPLDLFEEKAVLAASLPTDFSSPDITNSNMTSLSQFYERPLDLARLKIRITFAVRVKDHRKKESDYSSRITIVPQIVSQPPRHPKAVVHPDKIQVTWEEPAANIDSTSPAAFSGFQLYRAEGAEPLKGLTSVPIKGLAFEDKAFSFGRAYRYAVRTILGPAPPYLESEDSDVISITAEDTFPPSAPAGLKTVAGPGFISLSWEDGPEADLAGYRVWRKAASEEEFRLLTEGSVRETNYVDRAVQAGSRYAYALTALDKSGNESPRTKPVTETARSPRP